MRLTTCSLGRVMMRPSSLLLGLTLASGMLVSTVSNAQEGLLYTISSASGGSGLPKVEFLSTDADSVQAGDQVSVPLPNGTIATGSVLRETKTNPLNPDTMLPTTSNKHISLDGGGSVELHLNNTSIVGMTITDIYNQTFHRVVLDSLGSGALVEEDANNYICAHMPTHDPSNEAPLSLDPAEVPSLTQIQNLESLPGATKILYIDPWGGTLTGSAWNTNTGNPVITYEAYTQDADPAFSDTERYEIYHAWLEAAEDYAPFNVNVTTKTSLFTAASNANKSRIIQTTFATRNSQGICASCGGVAYVGAYGGSILFQTGWTFNSSIGSTGMTHSHEAGHQMGLSHDGGTANPSYYSGHGVWGPIMGAPFNKQYVQWSKGDYPGANNTENDFLIIDGKLGTLADLEDASSAPTGSNNIGSPTVWSEVRKAKPGGAVGSFLEGGAFDHDRDTIGFTVPPSGADITLKVTPKVGADTTQNAGGENRAANFSFQAYIRDSASANPPFGTVLSGDVSPLRPNDNKMDYAGNLAGGDYFLYVAGESPDTNWTTGFDNWGNGGEYLVEFTMSGVQYPYAECGDITGANHTFTFNNNGFTSTQRDFYIGSTFADSDIYSSNSMTGDAANTTTHAVTGLPVDGRTIYLRLYSTIDGVEHSEDTTCTTASGAPAIYAPLPGSILTGDYTPSGISDTIHWDSNGSTVTNYWLYVGSSLGGRQIHNSGDLGTGTSQFVTNIPANGRTVYVRLWYSADSGANWNYSDVTYRSRNNDNGPYLTDPAPGAALGDGIEVLWTDNGPNDPSDRYRVYAGPNYGSSTWTFSGNIAYDQRSYPISGWTAADYGRTVWVRFLYRKGGVWKRTNHSFVAGFGPATIDADETRPVPPGE